jgi:predicted dithiol-disulfide oxidoreductase (DUF899 family)
MRCAGLIQEVRDGIARGCLARGVARGQAAAAGPQGKVTLADMFDGCRQLFVHHIMFGPDWESACPSCTQYTSEFSKQLVERLRSRDTAFAMVCRAPIAKIDAYRAGRGWPVPWYSSYGTTSTRTST